MSDHPDFFRDVCEFARKFCPEQLAATPTLRHAEVSRLRFRLIHEELRELEHADRECDLPAVADALADLVYVTVGMAAAYGIDLNEVWRAVHAANMAKVGGGRDAGGKVTKPQGWTPPDIEGVLRRQRPLTEAPE